MITVEIFEIVDISCILLGTFSILQEWYIQQPRIPFLVLPLVVFLLINVFLLIAGVYQIGSAVIV